MKGEVSISNQFIATLMYHLAKNKLMLGRMMEILEDWVPRHKVNCLIYFRENIRLVKYLDVFMDR